MKKAYIFGCSHAAGSEMFDNDLDREYTHSYPALIAQDLGYEIHNHAIPGGSNDAIFRILIDIHQSITDQDMIIFCWIGAGRVEIYSDDDDQWLQFSVGRQTFNVIEPHDVARQGQATGALVRDHDGWSDYKQQWQKRWLGIADRNEKAQEYRNMLAAHYLASTRTQRIINIRSFAGYDHPYCDTARHFHWPIKHEEFWQWCHDRQFAHTDWGHFGAEAHRAFADYILDRLHDDFHTQ
jgi:hypothetical protein